MSADLERLERLAARFYGAWNSHDAEAVVACYTEDASYTDPNTRGPVVGHGALCAYLAKLFDRWEMEWRGRQLFPLESEDGSAALWSATLRPRGSDRCVTVDGMDLAILRGDRLVRNEVYFDRSVLATLLTTP
jgi:ketosteroid isomerase-like protein